MTGARDRALPVVGFSGALRRNQLAALKFTHDFEDPNGLVPPPLRFKSDQIGERAELVDLPRAKNLDRRPMALLQRWLGQAGITNGQLFRAATTASHPPCSGACAPIC